MNRLALRFHLLLFSSWFYILATKSSFGPHMKPNSHLFHHLCTCLEITSPDFQIDCFFFFIIQFSAQLLSLFFVFFTKCLPWPPNFQIFFLWITLYYITGFYFHKSCITTLNHVYFNICSPSRISATWEQGLHITIVSPPYRTLPDTLCPPYLLSE